jgi:hypothetical protein
MKYLKRFNESTSDFTNIISECQDILVELSDKDIKYRVYGYKGAKILGEETYKDLIRVEVGDQYNTVKLKDMDLMFEHLFSYMESEGFELGKDSYFENSNWDSHEACPECDGQSITPPDDFVDCGIDEELLDELMPLFEAIAADVKAKEREACAQVCYARCPMDGTVSVEVELARAIRARGDK